MPTYRVTIAGKTYTVEIPNPHARPVQAIVDGEVIEVDVEGLAATPMAATSPTVMGVPPVVTVPAQSAAPSVPQLAPQVVAQPPVTTSPSPVSTNISSNEVKAPLPGTVVSIDVAEGDTVEYGQELCILEAMKMNNPIRATQAGTVTQISIYIGQQVQHGEALMTIA